MQEQEPSVSAEKVAYSQASRRSTIRFGEIGKWLLNNHLETIKKRRDFDRQVQQHPIFHGAEAVAISALESIPYVGDAGTLFEALRGKTFDGMPLSVIERGIYLFFSVPPPFIPIDLPARPIITLYHELDKHVLSPLLEDILIDQPGEPIIGQRQESIPASLRRLPHQINRITPKNSQVKYA